ncbi:MAG: C1 family peptidase, partial [Bacteroidales bacterium]
MKTIKPLSIFLILLLSISPLFSQGSGRDPFKITGRNPVVIPINQQVEGTIEIDLTARLLNPVFGLVASGQVQFNGPRGLVRMILVDRNYEEHLLYETYPLIEDGDQVALDNLGEETVIMPGTLAGYLRIEVRDATLQLNDLTATAAAEPGLDLQRGKSDRKAAQNQSKIERLNRGLERSGHLWVAGATEVSELTWAEKRKLFGESTFPPGFEYYTGGIFSTGERTKSASASLMIDKWDWRDRHGKNWITTVKNQSSCGSCWAFAVTGATEALVNLFYNQQLNLDLSEQDVLSCSGAGSCSGGLPSTSLTYITNTGIVDELAFPYKASDLPCSNKSATPAQLIK